MNFRAMHQQALPLQIANVWDASSSQIAQEAGYAAIGTSSAAIASMLGYTDGEGLSFIELRQIVSRMRVVSDLPLTVDMEAGYADAPESVVANLAELAAIGVEGVNIEDSIVRQGQRRLLNAEDFATKLEKIKAGLTGMGIELFLNIRTDTYLLGQEDAQAETIRRGQMFVAAGADGFFVPCIVQEQDIATIVKSVPLPLNVMFMPELPEFNRLAELGVKRISMGNFVHAQLQQQLLNMLKNIRAEQSFHPVFDHASY
jgi:2-methylisocitrate lyase-like PEP mutase family enzyme